VECADEQNLLEGFEAQRRGNIRSPRAGCRSGVFPFDDDNATSPPPRRGGGTLIVQRVEPASFFDFAHILFGKPVSTFPEHALNHVQS
jgi:hypothetical protein